MQLLIEKIHEDAKEPVRANPDDSGADIFVHNFKRKYVMAMMVPQLDLSLMGEGKPEPIPVEVCIEEGNDPENELAEDSLMLMPLERALIGTGIKATAGLGYKIEVTPRSGLALKQGLSIVNSPGQIDNAYRGEIGAIVINLSNQPWEIKKGDRIAQLVVSPVEYPEIKVVEKLDETGRNEGGFGSSGKA